jgi:hypothetical protein
MKGGVPEGMAALFLFPWKKEENNFYLKIIYLVLSGSVVRYPTNR